MEKASVIIPSYNGGHKIGYVLIALLEQSLSDFELIVVIDGSTDNTREVLNEYRYRFGNFQIITQNNGGRSAARNAGARCATSEVLIFYDDDMIPYPKSVEQHVDFHKRNPGIVCGDMIEIVGKHRTDIQNYKARLTEKWTSKYAEGLNRMDGDGLYFTAANCSMKRVLFNELNGFDETLTDAEDYELASRARAMGIPVYFDRSIKAVHNEQITCRSYIMRLREYSAAHAKLRARNEYRRAESNQMVVITKSIIYRLFSAPVLVRLIDREL